MANREKNTPLADRLRPETLEEFLGQDEIVGQGKMLRRAITSGKPPSLIFWGPPGSGKTTLAHIIARLTEVDFIQMSAVTSGLFVAGVHRHDRNTLWTMLNNQLPCIKRNEVK